MNHNLTHESVIQLTNLLPSCLHWSISMLYGEVTPAYRGGHKEQGTSLSVFFYTTNRGIAC